MHAHGEYYKTMKNFQKSTIIIELLRKMKTSAVIEIIGIKSFYKMLSNKIMQTYMK